MKNSTIVLIVIVILMACCPFTHRRVIKAVLKKEPMPKAPNWHFWVPKDQRRG